MAKDPFTTFDWVFTDASVIHGARHHALAERPSETQQLMALIEVDSLVHYALFHQLPKGHPIRELWLETNTDLLATVYLAYGGFFRQALTVLRAWFEIAIHGVYFSEKNWKQRSSKYQQWRRGERNAPADMRKIVASLGQQSDYAESGVLRKLSPLYSALSTYTHAQSLDAEDLQMDRDNVPRYLAKSFGIWFARVFECADIVYWLYSVAHEEDIAIYLSASTKERESALSAKCQLKELLPNIDHLIVG